MLEKIFGSKRELTQEEAEERVREIMRKEFSIIGVNMPSIKLAFRKAKAENESKNLDLTNNHLLNLTREMARGMVHPGEVLLYGGPQITIEYIDIEIEKLRAGLTSEERRS